MRPLTGHALRGRRPGFTLIELVVITVLSAIVLGGLTVTLVRQQKFYRSTADVIETRSQLRQAAGILPAELRGLSSSGGDLVAISDTAITFRSTIGSSVACVFVGGAAVIVPPIALANGNSLTSWGMQPGPGDIVFVYNDGPTPAAGDDSWQQYTLVDGPTPITGGCPSTGPFTDGGDDLKASYSFTLNAALSPNIALGAPMRFVRPSQYRLYQSATDARWYLGYCTPVCGAASPEPVAGPFLPPGGNAGLSFTYLDSLGAVTAVPNNVAQISLAVRAQTRGSVDIGSSIKSSVGDSLRVMIAIRNRR